jgi:predicted nucleic acid-binding protein
MMETLYIDSNIFLNVLLEEEGLAASSLDLLQKVESGKYSDSNVDPSFMEIHRILQKQGKTEEQITNTVLAEGAWSI